MVCLQTHKDVQAYLQGRLSNRCIKRFHLGYAPPSGLIDELNKYDVEAQDAAAVRIVQVFLVVVLVEVMQ